MKGHKIILNEDGTITKVCWNEKDEWIYFSGHAKDFISNSEEDKIFLMNIPTAEEIVEEVLKK